jgi:hypothetical protein
MYAINPLAVASYRDRRSLVGIDTTASETEPESPPS